MSEEFLNDKSIDDWYGKMNCSWPPDQGFIVRRGASESLVDAVCDSVDSAGRSDALRIPWMPAIVEDAVADVVAADQGNGEGLRWSLQK